MENRWKYVHSILNCDARKRFVTIAKGACSNLTWKPFVTGKALAWTLCTSELCLAFRAMMARKVVHFAIHLDKSTRTPSSSFPMP